MSQWSYNIMPSVLVILLHIIGFMFLNRFAVVWTVFKRDCSVLVWAANYFFSRCIWHIVSPYSLTLHAFGGTAIMVETRNAVIPIGFISNLKF